VRTTRTIAAIIFGLAAGTAQAVEQYVGLQLINSSSSCEGFSQGVAPLNLTATCERDDNGFRASYGMWFSTLFGFEVGYQDAGEGHADAFAANGAHALTLTAPLKAWDVLFLARARLPEGFDLVGRLGAARWDYEVRSSTGNFGASNTKTTLTYGISLDWRWLTVGYDVIQDVGQANLLDPTAPDIKQDVKRFSIGGKWRF
jgi:hypothetical protein